MSWNHRLLLVALLVGAQLLAAGLLVAQEQPKIDGPTLKPTPPPMPPPATVKTSATPRPLSASTNGVAASAAEADEKPDIKLDLEGANVSEALKMYSDLTGRTVIQPSTLPAVAITIHSKSLLTRSEAILALESVMFANGVSVTPMGDKFVKAVVNQNVAREGVQLSEEEPLNMPEGDRITSQIINLRYLDVGDTGMVESLRQFIHQPGGTLIPLQRSNSILIIDTALSIKRLQEVLGRLDQPVENRIQTRYFPLKNAEAAKVAQLLQALIAGTQPTPGVRPVPVRPGQPPTGPTEESIVVGKVLIQSDDRTNTLIVMSRPGNFEFLEEIIAELDRTVEPEIRFKAFKLQHAKADDVAELILALTGSGAQPTIQRTTTTTRSNTRRLGGGLVPIPRRAVR